MVQINQNEVKYLVSKGYQFGDMLHRCAGKSKTYYATEDRNLLKDLKTYRNSVKVVN